MPLARTAHVRNAGSRTGRGTLRRRSTRLRHEPTPKAPRASARSADTARSTLSSAAEQEPDRLAHRVDDQPAERDQRERGERDERLVRLDHEQRRRTRRRRHRPSRAGGGSSSRGRARRGTRARTRRSRLPWPERRTTARTDQGPAARRYAARSASSRLAHLRDEHVGDRRVELRARASARARRAPASTLMRVPVRARRRHRRERVAGADDPRGERDLLARRARPDSPLPSQFSWLERTIGATLRNAGEAQEDPLADDRVLADELPLALVERPGLVEDLVGHRDACRGRAAAPRATSSSSSSRRSPSRRPTSTASAATPSRCAWRLGSRSASASRKASIERSVSPRRECFWA